MVTWNSHRVESWHKSMKMEIIQIKTMNRGKDEPVLVLTSFSLAWGYKLPPLSANDDKKNVQRIVGPLS